MSKIVLSYGGGWQTIAIACLIRQGRLPRPDRIVMADTGYEFKRVWEYTNAYVAPMLAEISLTIEIAPHSLSTVDLYSEEGKLLIPAYDFREDGGNGSKLRTYCSAEWKQRVVRRYIGGAKANPEGVEMWIGMSLDELGRLSNSDVEWCQNYYPLCYDVKMKRYECRDLVLSSGLPAPIKSRCKMCPNQDDSEWQEIKGNPDEWEEACLLDEKIFASHEARLHKSGVPLRLLQLQPHVGKKRSLDACEGICWI